MIFVTSTTVSASITASFTTTFPTSCVTTSFIPYAATSSTSFLQTFSTTKVSIYHGVVSRASLGGSVIFRIPRVWVQPRDGLAWPGRPSHAVPHTCLPDCNIAAVSIDFRSVHTCTEIVLQI